MHKQKPCIKYDYNRLKQYCKENNIILTKNYSKEKMNRETMIEAKCFNCSDDVKKNFRMLEKHGCFCKICIKKISKEKRKATNIERLGCENPMQNKGVKEKLKDNNIKRYGYENPFQNEGVKEKIKATNIKRYGCENPLQNKEVKEKRKTTNIERYGCEYPF